MPFFDIELNAQANRIRRSALTFRLHTAAPTNGAPTNGRITAGGGVYETGVEIASADIAVASNGNIEVNVDIDFETADEAVGTVTHVSSYRGTNPVGYRTLPSTTIGSGDSFKINSGLQFNGSST